MMINYLPLGVYKCFFSSSYFYVSLTAFTFYIASTIKKKLIEVFYLALHHLFTTNIQTNKWLHFIN